VFHIDAAPARVHAGQPLTGKSNIRSSLTHGRAVRLGTVRALRGLREQRSRELQEEGPADRSTRQRGELCPARRQHCHDARVVQGHCGHLDEKPEGGGRLGYRDN
jgi:hypothetical protein